MRGAFIVQVFQLLHCLRIFFAKLFQCDRDCIESLLNRGICKFSNSFKIIYPLNRFTVSIITVTRLVWISKWARPVS